MKQDNIKVVGNWMPSDKQALANWVNELIEKAKSENIHDINVDSLNVETKHKKEAVIFNHKEVTELKNLIEKDSGLFILTNQMIEQALNYNKEDPTGIPQINSYTLMLQMIDIIMDTAPKYNPPNSKGHSLIGFPINAILNWCMGTQAGYAFFLDSRVNECFKNILKAWCEFLSSSESRYVLNSGEDGWLCSDAKKELHIEDFKYNANKEYGGFKSWNDFFIREFNNIKKKRPVAAPDDDSIIVNACESTAYRISNHVHREQKFWLKGQPYSLEHMLNHLT